MIDHLSTYATDFAKTKAFYESVLGTLGHQCTAELQASWEKECPERQMCAFGPVKNKSIFWIIEVKESYTPRHFAFSAQDKEQVDAFYETGLVHGGRDNGAPGPRAHYHPYYYGGFLLDPDGNNIEAVFHRHGYVPKA